MLLIGCPWCGARSESEFRYCGEAHIARPRDPAAMDDHAWSDFLYMRTNPKGVHRERWRHVHGCGRFFNCVRFDPTGQAVHFAARPQNHLPRAIGFIRKAPLRTWRITNARSRASFCSFSFLCHRLLSSIPNLPEDR